METLDDIASFLTGTGKFQGPTDGVTLEVLTLRNKIRELQEALLWMSHSPDFGPGGLAEEGFKKIQHLLP